MYKPKLSKRWVKGVHNPGMNPFSIPPNVLFDSRWQIGDPGAVYEFNVKIQRVDAQIDPGDWERRRHFVAYIEENYPRHL